MRDGQRRRGGDVGPADVGEADGLARFRIGGLGGEHRDGDNREPGKENGLHAKHV